MPLPVAAALAGDATRAVEDACGLFTDASTLLCSHGFELYGIGITAVLTLSGSRRGGDKPRPNAVGSEIDLGRPPYCPGSRGPAAR
jgi:hypothetical protein